MNRFKMRKKASISVVQELILALIVIVFAITIFTRFISPFLFTDHAEHKYALNFLDLMDDYIRDLLIYRDEEFLTRTIKVTVDTEKYVLIGFSSNINSVEFDNTVFTKPLECESCICLFSNKKKNTLIDCKYYDKAKYGSVIFLGLGNDVCNPAEKVSVEYPYSEYQKGLKELIKDFGNTNFVIGKTVDGCKTPNLYLELKKVSEQGREVSYILATNDFNKDFARIIGLCQGGVCDGKNYFTVLNATHYCKYDVIKGICTPQEYSGCVDGRILIDCLCQGKLRTVGTCNNDKFYPIDCSKITSCETYKSLIRDFTSEDPCGVCGK